MTDRNDIIRAFERELNKKEEAFCSNEEKLLQSIANYLGAGKKEEICKNQTGSRKYSKA